MRIRPFTLADLPRLQAIRKAAFAPVFQSFRDITGPEISAIAFNQADADQAKLLEDIVKPGSGPELFVAERDGLIIGFVSMTLNAQRKTGEIGLNAVDPDHASQGVGAKMYDFVLQHMKTAGMELAVVSTGGDPSHAPARRAYEKAGFCASLPSQVMYTLLG
jgi:GNAT superfamily N-acetyltransferase